MRDFRTKVLLVEDDPESRELMAEILRAHFDVETAPDGPAALIAFRRERPDVVVTDEGLPGMRGTALAKEVKTLSPHAKVILVSGYLRPANADFCDLVLKKPVDVDELQGAVTHPARREAK